ncbi:reverse transcriptase (RNA-dependent DNA polymerase) domain-containing protein [Phthorimaea operculella]|nr:reverse transcriptase (RNA-dependent DNA polymerase) domain-containing protein [Phthorimaea operculella]
MKVRVGGNLTDAFEVITGLKQGDALSPMLFNLMLEYVVRKVLDHGDGVELNGTHKVIGYADDLALMGRSAADVRAMAGALESEGRKVGLRVNQDKTEYLHMKRFRTTRTKRNNLIVNGTSYN